jgi:hypothetical protein
MKKNLWGIAVSAVVMLFLPWLTVTFVKSNAAMAVCMMLFFAVNPLYSVALGILAGKRCKELWLQPIFAALLFLAGAWLFFDMGETAFLLYAGVYLALGLISMWICALIARKKDNSVH